MNPANPHVAIVSLGCPKNLVDSERLSAIMAEAGCIVGAPADDADVIVINTCGFLQAARAESLDIISQAVQLKSTARARRVIVAGCLVNRDGPNLLTETGVDAIIGVHDRRKILDAIFAEGPEVHISAPGPAASDAGRLRLTAPHTAFLRIAEGCSRNCTFCTIPSIRGPYRSKHPDAICDEARELIGDGAIELNVIAQDTTSYGCDLDDGVDLADLLGRLDRLDGVEWIRLLYTYPLRFDRKLIDTMAAAEHVVPYIDMPLQHIDGEILRRMGRAVGSDQVRDLLEAIRRAMPAISIRTTFIVGFPGETEAQFQHLLDFVADSCFEAMGAFAYSPEPGTPAATMPDQIPEQVKQKRLEAIMSLQQEISLQVNQARLGSELDVLVDGTDEQGACFGRHGGQAPDIDGICYLDPPAEPGSLVRGKVVGADEYDLHIEPTATIRPAG
ncbi:MAG: 30S ribosomal protein S12 methylthiotransferase RimO [Phycisphaerae bacterium]